MHIRCTAQALMPMKQWLVRRGGLLSNELTGLWDLGGAQDTIRREGGLFLLLKALATHLSTKEVAIHACRYGLLDPPEAN